MTNLIIIRKNYFKIVDNFHNLISSFSPWYILHKISKYNDYFVKAEMHDSLHSFRARNLTFPSSFVVIDRALITSQEFRCVWISLFERGHALRSRTPSLAFNYEDMRDLASKFASSNETALFPGISVRYSFLRVQSKLQKRSCPAAIKRFQLRFQRFSTFVRISRHIVARIFRVSKFLHEKPCKLYLVSNIWNKY